MPKPKKTDDCAVRQKKKSAQIKNAVLKTQNRGLPAEPARADAILRVAREPSEQNYLKAIEFYDFMPRYVRDKVERIQEKFLEPIEKDFVECRGESHRVRTGKR